ncbi:Molybdenum cofactor biosynthesis protein B [compost metagenome]
MTSRDGTYEAIDGLLEKRLTGFGELFRMLSFNEIGSAAMMSRATAGTVGRKAIFVLPGSENAVRLAMTRLIIPELGHIVQQVTK